MTRKVRVIVNVVALQAGWFACVLGAAGGRAWIGPAFVLLHLMVHFGLTNNRRRDAMVIVATGLVGIIVDGGLMRSGVIAFDAGTFASVVAPLWMIALWVNLATSLNLTLGFLHGRPALAAILGALSGALAYVGGLQMGAISMPAGVWIGGTVVGATWAVLTPVLIGIAGRLAKRRTLPTAITAMAEA